MGNYVEKKGKKGDMCIADYLIVIVLALYIINCILITFYCIAAEAVDKRYFKRRESALINNNDSIDNSKSNQKRVEMMLSRVFHFINPYLYGLMRYNVILVGRIPSFRIRHFFYKYIYRMKITSKTVIYGGCEIRSPWNVSIGNSVISAGCILDGRQKIIIGDNVVFGSGVHLWTEEHDPNDSLFRVTPEHSQPIIIEDFSWICSDSTILPGVHINRGVVVASRACVTKDCESFSIYGGIPAKKISERNTQMDYKLDGKPTWHFY